MRRRDFITLLGGAAATWPLAARAQQHTMPVIGFLSTRTPDESEHVVAAFRRGLAESGYVEGQNVAVEYRWALGDYDRLPALAAELVRLPVAVLAATGGDPAALAATTATATIPVVATFSADPVARGLVASLNRPSVNVTGVNNLTSTLETKRFGLLRELVPQAATIGVLLNPTWPLAASQLRDMQEGPIPLVCKFISCAPAAIAKSIRHSNLLLSKAFPHSWWPAMRSSTRGATGLRPWRRAMRCPRCTVSAIMPWPAA